MDIHLIFLSILWLLIPLIAWADKRFIYKKGILTEIETKGSIYGYYFTRSLFEVVMLTAGFYAGRMF